MIGINEVVDYAVAHRLEIDRLAKQLADERAAHAETKKALEAKSNECRAAYERLARLDEKNRPELPPEVEQALDAAGPPRLKAAK